jgi:hypothetical protein
VDSKPAIATTKTNEPALSSSLNQEPIEKFDPKILVGGKLDLPRQEAKIWMTSSIVNSNFDVVIGDWERKDPTAIAGPFALGLLKERSMSEKYRLKFYRDLPLAIRAESVFGLGNLDLKGGVLRSSLKRNIELPKKVPGNLEAGVVVDNTPFAITPESRRGEQKILMDYTLNF